MIGLLIIIGFLIAVIAGLVEVLKADTKALETANKEIKNLTFKLASLTKASDDVIKALGYQVDGLRADKSKQRNILQNIYQQNVGDPYYELWARGQAEFILGYIPK